MFVQIVELEFYDFDIEYEDLCILDYVSIFNGASPTNEENLIDKMCGNSLPSTKKSDGNSMTVVFRSDYQVSRLGFDAEFRFMAMSNKNIKI